MGTGKFLFLKASLPDSRLEESGVESFEGFSYFTIYNVHEGGDVFGVSAEDEMVVVSHPGEVVDEHWVFGLGFTHDALKDELHEGPTDKGQSNNGAISDVDNEAVAWSTVSAVTGHSISTLIVVRGNR